jgi:hypothetical protein
MQGRTMLPGAPLGQESKRQGIQLDSPTVSLGVTCGEPHPTLQRQGLREIDIYETWQGDRKHCD